MLGRRRRQNRRGIGGGVLPFLPTQLSGCVLWLRADLGITKDGSDFTSAWVDQSGNGYNATAAGTARPIYGTSAAYNNQAVLDFDGAANHIDGAAGSGVAVMPAAGTWFVVFDYDVISTNAADAALYNNDCVFSEGASATAGLALRSATPHVKPWKFDGSVRTVGQDLSATTPTICSWTSSGTAGTLYHYQDGGNVQSVTIPGTVTAAAGVYRVGCNYSAAQFFDGRVAEIIAYTRVLSAGEHSSVVAYLGTRYGIAV